MKRTVIKIIIGILIFIIGIGIMISVIPYAKEHREDPTKIGSEFAIPIALEIGYFCVLGFINDYVKKK